MFDLINFSGSGYDDYMYTYTSFNEFTVVYSLTCYAYFSLTKGNISCYNNNFANTDFVVKLTYHVSMA